MNTTDLARFVEAEGIQAEIVLLPQETPTVETAASAVGVDSDQIVKSVLFLVQDGKQSRPILVIGSGTRYIDQRKLADYCGVGRKRVKLAKPAEVEAVTGFPVGTVPPFGHKESLTTLLDRQVLSESEIYAGGGAINALIRLQVSELQRVLQAEVADLAQAQNEAG